MSSQDSFDNTSQNNQYDQQQLLRNRYKIQAMQSIKSISFNNKINRTLLSTSYRILTAQLHKIQHDKFNLNHSQDMIQEMSRLSYFYQPYQIGDYQFKFYSSICKQAIKGHRKCKEPLIKIDHQPINFQGRNEKIIVREKPFLLAIQGQPNSTIIYTNKPKTHPLLIFTEQDSGQYYIKRMFQKCSQMMTPPCDLSIVIIKDPFKIQSKLLYLKIMSNQSQQTKNRKFQMGWAIRAQESFNYQDSASGNALSYSMNQQSL